MCTHEISPVDIDILIVAAVTGAAAAFAAVVIAQADDMLLFYTLQLSYLQITRSNKWVKPPPSFLTQIAHPNEFVESARATNYKRFSVAVQWHKCLCVHTRTHSHTESL